MGTMAEYRKLGVTLVARALGCVTLSLVEQDPRGHVRVTTWDRTGEITLRGWVVDGATLRALSDLPVLRPALDDAAAIVLTVQSSDLGLAGWRLVGAGAFAVPDLEAAARLAAVLADPGMRQQEAPAPPARTEHSEPARGRRSAPIASTLLTAREAEVLSLVGAGLTARAVARRCGISERTVQKHLEQAYRKLDCHDRLSAVLLARDCGLLAGETLVTVA